MAFIFRGTHLIDAHGNYFASIYQTLILSPKPYLEEEKKDQFDTVSVFSYSTKPKLLRVQWGAIIPNM